MDIKEAKRFLENAASYPSRRAAYEAMGLAKTTFRDRLVRAQEIVSGGGHGSVPASRSSAGAGAAGVPTRRVTPRVDQDTLITGLVEGNAEVVDKKLLADEVANLRLQNKKLAEQVLTDEQVRRHIFEIAHSKPAIPEWISVPSSSGREESLPGVPVLFGSDWHWGEVVKPSEIGGVNEYNLDIARARLVTLIDTTIDLLTNHMVNPKYPGIVFALGGDMVSGNIHEELSETNDAPIMPVVLDLVDHLYIAINRLKEVFGRVFLPCVAGNHGRSTKKIRAKEFNFNSYDWLIYQQLDRLFADDPDVIFYIPDGTDALVNIAGHKYLFTHGNQFRSFGDSMIGALGPVVRGDHKKRGRNAQVGQEYDTLVLGHFHQLMQMKRVIMNGSLIGYNEYAYTNNFGYEPPQQALWLSHPVHGITFSMPVNVGEDFARKKRNAITDQPQPWVSFHDAKRVM